MNPKMRTVFLSGLVILLSVIGSFLIYNFLISDGTNLASALEKEIQIKSTEVQYLELEATAGPDDAREMEYLMTHDPKTGKIPPKALWEAYQESKRRRDADGVSPSDIEWEERGPWNVGGRTRTVMYDPNDPVNRKLWVGSVSGGLWYTETMATWTPTWVKVDDFWEGLAISCMAYDPTNKDNFYVGTGEGFAWRGIGVGIYKSTDGGVSWDTIQSTFHTPHFRFVNDIEIHPSGDIYAATWGYNSGTEGGIMRSKDDGKSWERVLSKSTVPMASHSNRGGDLEIGSDGYIYASLGVYQPGGMYRSITGDAGDWTFITTGIDTANTKRFEMAVSNSAPNIVYAAVSDTNQSILGVYRSTNRGDTWTAVSTPMIEPGKTYAEGQAAYDNILAVDPVNPDYIYAGGVKLFRSFDGGNNWFKVDDVHDDIHELVFKPGTSDVLTIGTDGGIYLFYPTTPELTVWDMNNGYNVTQFYTLAYHPLSMYNFMLGGTQDNGTPRFEDPGMNVTSYASGADGAWCFINKWTPQYQITGKQWNHWCRSSDWGATFTDFVGVNKGWLIPPADYDPENGNLYSSVSPDSILRIRNSRGDYSYDFLDTLGMGSMGSAIKISPFTNYTMLVGTNKGKLFRVEGPDQDDYGFYELNTVGLPNGNISCIAYGSDNQHILITMSNYGTVSVWETLDYCDTWINKEGNLPNMPVRWAVFNPLDYRQVFLATELGVWSTEDITVTNPVWVPANGGLVYVRIDQGTIRRSVPQFSAAS